MKLYKIDFKNLVGQNCVSVPTDSEILIGLSNGDADSTAKLYDGETELSATPDKIGDYTCFKIETGKDPFVKEYKGLFSGFNPVVKYWDAHSYDITDGVKNATMAIVDADVFAMPNASDPQHPTPPSAESIQVMFKDASGQYSTTLTYTYDKVALAGGVASSFYNAPAEIDEAITSAYPVPKIIRFKNLPISGWGWNKIEPNYTGQSSTVNWKATPLVADIEIPYTDDAPYTQEVKIRLEATKQSIAYRDLEGGAVDPEDIVEAVEDSGKFQTALKPLTLDSSSSGIFEVDIDDTNFLDVERTIYEIGTSNPAFPSDTIAVTVDLADFPVEPGSTQMFKFNLKINCAGDAVSMPDNLIAITITDGLETYTLSTDDFYVYTESVSSLTSLITNSPGYALLVELVFDTSHGYAYVKGCNMLII